jgi:hypothetical protein
MVSALTLWAASLWNSEPQAPRFNELRPYDEF